MSQIALMIMFAVLNCFRGRGLISGDRVIACLLMGISAMIYGGDIVFGTIVAVGVFFWAVWGWDLGAVTGDYDDVKFHKWIRWTANKILPTQATDSVLRIRAHSAIKHSLRGLYLYPMCLLLFFYTLKPIMLITGLFGLLQGVCYFVVGCFPGKYVKYAEALFGAVIGYMVSV